MTELLVQTYIAAMLVPVVFTLAWGVFRSVSR